MQKTENSHTDLFNSADEMVNSLVSTNSDYSICPSIIEVNEKGLWFYLLIGFGVVIFLLLDVHPNILQDVHPNILQLVIIGPFVIYALIKGFRSRPDALIISDNTIWLITGVVFNRNSDTFSYNTLYEIPKSEVKKDWNIDFFSRDIKFKVPNKMKVIVRQEMSMNINKHYTYNTIYIGDAKKQIFS